MKKTGLLLGVLVLVLSLLLTGCGVAQNEYDAVVAERDTARSQLNTAQSQIATLQSDYAAAQSEIETLEGDVSQAQGNYDTLKQKVDKAKLYGEILEKYYFVPAFILTTEEVLELSRMVDTTGDAVVIENWTTYVDSTTDENFRAFYLAVWDGLWEALR